MSNTDTQNNATVTSGGNARSHTESELRQMWLEASRERDELLEALKDLVDTCNRIGAPPITKGGLCEENDWHYDMRKAKAAIAKVEGGVQ